MSPEAHLTEQLTLALKALGIRSPRVILEKPRDASHGDIATNAAMISAKELGQPPRAIADSLVSSLRLDSELISSVSVAGPGFINFSFSSIYLHSIATEVLDARQSFGRVEDLKGIRVLIEFVSANPSGPLNVVSARAAAVGSTLIRLFQSRGAEAQAEFYVNDAGNQVRLLGESARARYESLLGFPCDIPEGGYHGEYLVDFARQVVAEHGDKFHSVEAQIVSDRLGRLAIEHFVSRHRASLENFRVKFDSWFSENALRVKKGEQSALEDFKSRGVTYEKDGATFLRTSAFGDGQDWVVVTSDGRPTYFLPDIAYHRDKFDRGFDVIIDILGPDHHAYLTKMHAALNALGYDSSKLEVILLQHVTLLRNGEPVKMSKRAGTLIEMDELVEEVGVDAARYFFLLRKTSTPLDFDIELAKKQSDENPVFYVQYAHARIESIFRKSGAQIPNPDVNLDPLVQAEELDLLRRIRELPFAIRECTLARDPHGITTWLRETATQFHKFYHNCRVITDPSELQSARLALCRATQIALANGLALCGVNAPNEM